MESLAAFNWLDYTLLALTAAFVAAGYVKGFTRQVLQLIGILIAFYIAMVYTPDLATRPFLARWVEQNPQLTHLLTYVGLFVGSILTWNLAIAIAARLMPGRRIFRPVDGLLGGFLGAIKAVLVVGGICLGLITWGSLNDYPPFRQSVLAPKMAASCKTLVLLIPESTRVQMHHFNDRVQHELRSRKLLNPPPPNAPDAVQGNPAVTDTADTDTSKTHRQSNTTSATHLIGPPIPPQAPSHLGDDKKTALQTTAESPRPAVPGPTSYTTHE